MWGFLLLEISCFVCYNIVIIISYKGVKVNMRKRQELENYRTLVARIEPSLIDFIQEESHRQNKSMALLISDVLRDYQRKMEKKSVNT